MPVIKTWRRCVIFGKIDFISKDIAMIMLADDDIDDRDFFSEALKQVSGSTLLVLAENGLDLMQKLQPPLAPQPTLVFVDLNMPLKNGYECLAEIKQTEALKHLPVIVISTSVQQEAVSRVYMLGASLYVVKPNSFGKLKDILRQILSRQWQGKATQPSKENFILRE